MQLFIESNQIDKENEGAAILKPISEGESKKRRREVPVQRVNSKTGNQKWWKGNRNHLEKKNVYRNMHL